MLRPRRTGFALAAFLAVVTILGTAPAGAQQRLSAGGAHMQGAFFIWVAAATSVINKYVPGVRARTLTTLGSTENVALMEKGKMELGAVGSVPLYEAYNGLGSSKQPVKSLRSLFVMYPDFWQIAVRKDSTANGLADLKGRKISLQVKGSGGYAITIANLKAAGLKEEDMNAQYLSADASIQAIKDGQIEGFSMHGGAPLAGFLDLAQSRVGLKLISLSDDDVARITRAIPYYSKQIISKDIYPGLPADVVTVGGVSVFVAHEKLAEETAYLIVKALSEHTAELVLAYAPSAYSTAQNTVRETAKYAPLHPGAVRYFKEKGLM
ncbi:MAG: TAXI family TRAP transporter solute-binding subunit [Proteobacteria bacterium]|nr:TAXI family TRAP transporter solute-binding subunit [Pseudomonadota bacterium]